MLKSSEVISNPEFKLFSEENKRAYYDRYIFVKSLFSKEEIQKLKTFAEEGIRPEDVMVKGDQSGNLTKRNVGQA